MNKNNISKYINLNNNKYNIYFIYLLKYFNKKFENKIFFIFIEF